MDAFQLAKDMREFLSTFGPIPPQRLPSDTEKQKLVCLAERTAWRKRLHAAYELRFLIENELLLCDLASAAYL